MELLFLRVSKKFSEKNLKKLLRNIRMNKSFEREYSLEDSEDVLVLSQLEEGDVNCVVWDAALVLAKYLEIKASKQPEWLQNKRVMELGAGLGCVGLVAAYYGGNVTLTDQPKAMNLLEHNVQTNLKLLESKNAVITTRGLDWSISTDMEPFEIILLADCIYYEESILPLINTLVQLSNKETEIYLSQEDRSYSDIQAKTWNEFSKQIKHLFDVHEIPCNEQHQLFQSHDIHLLRLCKKQTI